MSHTIGIILTGGASRRMGTDKATMAVGGKPMVVRVADALWETGLHPVECQGGDAVTIEELGLRVFPDPDPGSGPVAAIQAALDRHVDCNVVTVACDLVDIDSDTVGALVAAGDAADRADAVVGVADGHRHMLAWWRAGAAAKLAAVLSDGVEAYTDALDRLTAVELPVAATAVRNLNTPDDLGSDE